MAHVLIVEDEPRYRRYAARLLEAEGHRVVEAAGAREAIERGTREPLELAVLDWMLGEALHGLHALDALRAVKPELPGVLVTGFPSAELEESARRAGVSRLVEKPFEPEELRAAVEEALAGAPPPRAAAPGLAVVEIGAEGRIAARSPAARALLDAQGLEGAASPEALLAPGGAAALEEAARGWREARPRRGDRERWWLRAQPAGAAPAAGNGSAAGGASGGRLAVLHRGPGPPDAGIQARVGLLLGLEPEGEAAASSRLEGPVLLVDPDLFLRRVGRSLLEGSGVPVHACESGEHALALLERAPAFRCALVDEAAPGLERLVATLRRRFPEIALVGQADGTPSEVLRALGVEPVLRKPWSMRQLVAALCAGPDGGRG